MASKDHCIYCFDALIAHFNQQKPPSPLFTNDSYPLFVSWHKQHRNGKDLSLRGCKGTFSPKKLHSGLSEFALISALKDTRFSPVTFEEVTLLECGVSLLTHFEDVASVWDWEIGIHGIIIDFVDPKGEKRNATYLPEVALEQEWDKKETLISLIEKSGYKGKVTETLLSEIRLTRYQSSKVKVHYTEYLSFKQRTLPTENGE